MKISLDIDENIAENEIVIHCKSLTDDILTIQKILSDNVSRISCMELKLKEKVCYVETRNILFFETDSRTVYAHTRDNLYETDYKLYELEANLPSYFIRVSKSAIVNMDRIISIIKNVAASSVIEFEKSSKTAYVSRQYYKQLIERINERKLHNR